MGPAGGAIGFAYQGKERVRKQEKRKKGNIGKENIEESRHGQKTV